MGGSGPFDFLVWSDGCCGMDCTDGMAACECSVCTDGWGLGCKVAELARPNPFWPLVGFWISSCSGTTSEDAWIGWSVMIGGCCGMGFETDGDGWWEVAVSCCISVSDSVELILRGFPVTFLVFLETWNILLFNLLYGFGTFFDLFFFSVLSLSESDFDPWSGFLHDWGWLWMEELWLVSCGIVESVWIGSCGSVGWSESGFLDDWGWLWMEELWHISCWIVESFWIES